MKPREFDELIRQKFDQNDFAYSPKNWDKLAEELNGRAKKRSMIMWLWMPAAGMAASVALALGVTTLLRFGAPADKGTNGEYTQTSKFIQQQPAHNAVAMITDVASVTAPQSNALAPQNAGTTKIYRPKAVKSINAIEDNAIGIKLSNVLAAEVGSNTKKSAAEPVNLGMAEVAAPKTAAVPKAKKPPVIEKPGYNTFAEEQVAAVKPPAKFSIIVSGGISQGSHNSGYAAGATVRRMINEKVYVEGDIALASSDNTQRTQYMSYDNGGGAGATAARPAGTAAKLSKVESGDKPTTITTPEGTLKTTDVSYNLYYAQITPSIGYKILKKMSVGVGPDFQKMLVDNRPPVSTVDRGTIQVAPTFDVGFMGKTEYALTKKVKAAVYYRKGINGLISLSDKYIDRDYLQFQVKCTIFNK